MRTVAKTVSKNGPEAVVLSAMAQSGGLCATSSIVQQTIYIWTDHVSVHTLAPPLVTTSSPFHTTTPFGSKRKNALSNGGRDGNARAPWMVCTQSFLSHMSRTTTFAADMLRSLSLILIA